MSDTIAIEEIKNNFVRLCHSGSDINEHLNVLSQHAMECESVLELGVRGCVSSWAFAHGLLSNNSLQKQLFLNDLTECNISDFLSKTNKTKLKVDYEWINDLDLVVTQNFDLVFIDTWHVYGQLKRELNKFSKVTNKYIIMHDTTVDGIHGESIREGFDINQQAINTGFSIDEIKCGLWPAIEEFLETNPEWELKVRYVHNNGLTILQRK